MNDCKERFVAWLNKTFNDHYKINVQRGVAIQEEIVHHGPDTSHEKFWQLIERLGVKEDDLCDYTIKEFVIFDEGGDFYLRIYPLDNRIIHTNLIKEDKDV